LDWRLLIELAIGDSIAHPIVFACVLLVAVVISLLLALSPVLIAVRPDLQPILR
jgi:hypothetical protein